MYWLSYFITCIFIILNFSLNGQYWNNNSIEKHSCCKQAFLEKGVGTYEQNPKLHDYNISFYKLDVQVEPDEHYIEGIVTIKAKSTHSSLDTLVFELMDYMDVEEVLVNNTSLDFIHSSNEIVISLNEPISKGSYFEVSIDYSGMPESDHNFFSGMNTGTCSYGTPVMWTLSQPNNARQWWPCKQVLEDKADSVHVFITTPDEFIAASNGLLTNVTDLPENKVRYEWKSNYPIAYYLISLAVAKYREYNFYAPLSNPEDSVFIQNFIYDHDDILSQNKEEIDLTKDFMTLFSELFGDYPFASEKYGHAMAPMGGGMEHQTISTMGFFSFDIISHELAHHWFGNNVTCATWNDIWINEGFATYSEYLALEHLESREKADQKMAHFHNSVISEPGGSVFIPYSETTDVWRIFNGRLSYRKGAAIIHLLRFEIDDDQLFFDILKEFQQIYKDSVATGEDFRKVVDEMSSKNWEWFFQQWYYDEGHPVFDIKWNQKNDSIFLTVEQHRSADTSDFFATSFEMKFSCNNSDTIVRFFQSNKNQNFSFYYPCQIDDPSKVKFDPNNWLFKEFQLREFIGEETEKDHISVYPNPFLNKLFIKRHTQISEKLNIDIFDVTGQRIYSTILENDKATINTHKWSSGLFIIEIKDNNGSTTHKKIIKN